MHPTAAALLFLIVAVVAGSCTAPESSPPPTPEAVAPEPKTAADDGPKVVVTTLTTNGADFLGGERPLQGEWSFAAWIEVGESSFLFDTGWSPTNVLHNAEILGIDLSVAEDLILSHNHLDHTGGLETLRRELSKINPLALSRIHVAEGIFASRPGPDGTETNPMVAARGRLEALGSVFLIYDQPTEISPGVWLTGPVPRVHEEKNYPLAPTAIVVVDGQQVPDVIPESQSLVVLAKGGPVFVSGCGHAGLINTLEYGERVIADQIPQAAIGGFHLFNASDETLAWTAEKIRERRLGHLLGAHCTGFETVVRIRELAGMPRERAVIGAIGTRFESGSGIVTGNINR